MKNFDKLIMGVSATVTITLSAEQEKLLVEAVSAGLASSMEEAIDKAVHSLRAATATGQEPKARNLSELLMNSPFYGAGLNLERSQELPRPVEME